VIEDRLVRIEDRVARAWPGLWRAANDLVCAVTEPVRGAACRRTRTPAVALTFDDGPDPATTPAILDALAAAGARATFFFIGERVAAHPELARRVAAAHQVGTHLHTHRRGLTPAIFADEIRRVREVHERVLGAQPVALRFPYGERGGVSRADVRAAGLRAYHWTFSSLDWRLAHDVVGRVVPRLAPGSIVLMHDGCAPGQTGARNRNATVCALPVILEELARRKLAAVTLEELRDRGRER
jgi:peptidoglycan/xylan/chitin deacetylase (PgdA/CDA1 family)